MFHLPPAMTRHLEEKEKIYISTSREKVLIDCHVKPAYSRVLLYLDSFDQQLEEKPSTLYPHIHTHS